VDPTANVPFAITPAGQLQRSKSQVTRTLIFSLNGDFPIKSPTDPFFLAAPSLGNFPTANRRATAEQRLRQLAQVKNPVIRSTNPIQIDGLDGFESIADAQDDKTATPIVVYQVMFFDETSYILQVGIVGQGQSDEFLPAFQHMAKSLKRK
jgi:hypothetical protein